jgi:hypothetical protein
MTAARGQSLPEVLIALGVMLAALAGVASISQSPARGIAATSALPAIIGEARALAATSGDGATVILAPEDGGAAPGFFRITLFSGRPRPGGSFDPASPLRSERFAGRLWTSAAGAGAVAIFISSAGGASYAAWSPAQALLPSEPTCAEPLSFTAAGSRFRLACAGAGLAAER